MEQPFNFKSLPLEIRDLIWECTLPDRRIFHVKRFRRQPNTTDRSTREMFSVFHIEHPAPSATRVCAESRAVALRKGFFISPQGDFPGYWFNPDKDVLYLDRNQRTSFHVKPGEPRMSIPGWDRVLHVGVEWRAFFRDIPRPSQDETMATYWRAAVEPLYSYVPSMKTLNYILPQARYKGGITWGREPYGAQAFGAELLPLPAATSIPWETSRNLGGAGQLLQAQLLTAIQGTRAPAAIVLTWEQVKNDIEQGFEEAEGEDHKQGRSPCHEQKYYPPEVKGWRLVRPDLPLDELPQHSIVR
ncbi:hypothetical protein BGZ63DRAFT_413522 [Mariannaea sp. PMI_226]|nr:hypothetical protein BGZ63DRAFT_413522 [Mariannaea sp. PMI_226]